MAGSVNLVILVGNLGQDPDIVGSGDRKVAKLSVATSESWKDKASGERKETTDWHNVVVFQPSSVEFAEKYLKKGNKVYVEGKQRTRKYEKDGSDRYMTEVVCGFGSKLQSLTKAEGRGAPSEDDYGTPGTNTGDSRTNAPASSGGRPGNDMDDDIPF